MELFNHLPAAFTHEAGFERVPQERLYGIRNVRDTLGVDEDSRNAVLHRLRRSPLFRSDNGFRPRTRLYQCVWQTLDLAVPVPAGHYEHVRQVEIIDYSLVTHSPCKNHGAAHAGTLRQFPELVFEPALTDDEINDIRELFFYERESPDNHILALPRKHPRNSDDDRGGLADPMLRPESPQLFSIRLPRQHFLTDAVVDDRNLVFWNADTVKKPLRVPADCYDTCGMPVEPSHGVLHQSFHYPVSVETSSNTGARHPYHRHERDVRHETPRGFGLLGYEKHGIRFFIAERGHE